MDEFKPGEYLREYFSKNKNIFQLSTTEIIEKLLSTDKIIAKYYENRRESLRRTINNIKSKDFITVTNNAPKKIKTPYQVVGDKHYFNPIKGSFSLPNELVDKLFYSFSKHGLNLSTTQMINEFNLEPWQWHAIKNSLELYKLSNIFSPHTVNKTDPETMKQMIRDKMDERINTLGFIVENEYNNSIIKKYKDVIKKSTTKDLELTSLINELVDLLPQVKINKKKCCSESHIVSDEVLVCTISDIHFGLNNANSDISPSYSTETTKESLDKIVTEINSHNAKEVHILNLGDIIESFQGNNHIGSWKGLESGYYGSRLVIECYQLFVNFLSQINNLKSYNQVAGNHDRSSSDRNEDQEGFISRIIFEFIKNSFQDSDIDFEYNDLLISKKIGNINYIMTHGHLGISKMSPGELILEYAEDTKLFTILLQGHKHDRQIKKDHKMFRDIIVPAIMPGNNYSITSGFSGTSGFMIIKERYNKPLIMDYSL